MHKSLERLIADLGEQAKAGIDSRDHDILRALRIEEAQTDISRFLEEGYSVTECVRVYLTRTPEWVEVLVRLAPPPGGAVIRPPRLLITYDGVTGILVSVSKEFGEHQDFTAETQLPFALAAPSYTEAVQVPADDAEFMELSARRDRFLSDAIAVLSTSSTTPYQTNSQTGYPSAVLTPYPTSGVTTPNDNDTRTDNRGDSRTDYRTDSTTDTRLDD